MKRRNWIAAAVVLLANSGCASLNLETLADVIGGAGAWNNQVRGEVERVDDRRREIEIRSDTRQQTRVHYDSRTEVLYRNRQYPITSLEGGDRVLVRFERSQQGELYAQQVLVEELREGTGGSTGSGRVEQFDGRVGSVDTGRGRFTLQATRTTYTVTLPYNASRTVTDRFNRLRAGDSIRIEGELLNNGRIELHRFR